MRILYGVQGTGNGHISRARMMAKHLHAKNAAVDFLFSGRAPENYFDMECFGNFETRRGLSFIARRGAISYWQTLRQSHAIRFINDVRALDTSLYDVIVTDFEPVTAWAGLLSGKTVIGVGHQYAFHHAGVPRCNKHLISRVVLRAFAPVNIGVGLHWSAFGAPILPPIINPEVERGDGDRILVYLPFENQAAVTGLLNRIPDHQFLQYSYELEDGQAGNVELRKANLIGFKRDLQQSRAVICNAGFELVSECLHLGKPVLTRPMLGQGEQIANALALQALHYADIMTELSAERILTWLRVLPLRRPIEYPDVAQALVDWLLSGNWRDTRQLSEELWEKTRMAGGTNGTVASAQAASLSASPR